MTPSITAVRMTGSAHRAELPLLVLGPSPDASAMTLWSACAVGLTDEFDVIAWDLPGHGHNRSVPEEPFTMAELASGVLGVVDDILLQREDVGGRFYYAGDSVGGAVGLQLLLDTPGRVLSVVVLSAESLDEGDAPVFGARADGDVPVFELFGAAYLNPAAVPDEVARLLLRHFLGDADPDPASNGVTDFANDLEATVRSAIADGVSVDDVKQALLAAASQCDRPARSRG